jgi:L,D-transpeptidase catalytic domain
VSSVVRGALVLGCALSLTAGAPFDAPIVSARGTGAPPDDVPTLESTTTTVSPSTTLPAEPDAVEAGASPVAGLPRQDGQIQLTEPPPPPPPPTTAPPPDILPENSGSGRRVVYSKTGQRVWAVAADGTVEKTHLVSGRLKYNQPTPGTYHVFSRSAFTCNIKDPSICWRYMIRFAVGGDDGDNIGLHEIPTRNGVPVQSISQLGQPLSGGCVRQAPADAIWMWGWAPVGTTVVVLQ